MSEFKDVPFKTGDKVRCLRFFLGGCEEGKIYTVAVCLSQVYVHKNDCHISQTTDMWKSLFQERTSVCFELKKPAVILVELAYPYLVNADRFELVA